MENAGLSKNASVKMRGQIARVQNTGWKKGLKVYGWKMWERLSIFLENVVNVKMCSVKISNFDSTPLGLPYQTAKYTKNDKNHK